MAIEIAFGILTPTACKYSCIIFKPCSQKCKDFLYKFYLETIVSIHDRMDHAVHHSKPT